MVMRTTIDLPEPLLKNAKRRATERGVTLSMIVEDALRNHFASKPPATMPPFRLYTVRGKLVRPDLDLDRTSALLVEDDASSYIPEKK
jgi:hypothetical protein